MNRSPTVLYNEGAFQPLCLIKTAQGAKLILKAGLAYPVSFASLGHLLMA